jgi:putative ABC transport system permease protein
MLNGLSSRLRRSLLAENIRMAMQAILEHRLRSGLTVLGIIIGIAAVVIVGSLFVGLDQEVQTILDAYGRDTLFVTRLQDGLTPKEIQARKVLTLDDAMAIQERCPSVKQVTVAVSSRNAPIRNARYQSREVTAVSLSGALPSYDQVLKIALVQGRFFTESEDRSHRTVAVIGFELADTLFPAGDALGKTIVVAGLPLEIVGVREKSKTLLARQGDKNVLVPYRTFRQHESQADEHLIIVRPWPGRKEEAEDEMRALLRVLRRVDPGAPDDFGITSTEAASEEFRQIVSSIALVTIAVSSMGLLIGGVGVTNIMLMSVTQRTREIGVRKAVGARKGDIVRQFLAETVTLTGVGGLIGIATGIGGSALINLVFPSAVPLWSIVIGFAVSVGVGLVSGMYPAVKAAKLDPVEALRYE